MQIAIVFHAYFDVDVEEMVEKHNLYVSDKLFSLIEPILRIFGVNKLKNDRILSQLKEDEFDEISYQDLYKILKRLVLVSLLKVLSNIILLNFIVATSLMQKLKIL